jgi:hypothetical protein
MSIRPLGVMKNYTVIEAVGRTLAELLKTEMEDPVQVSIASPGEDYGAPVDENGKELGISRINLFLYRIVESPYAKNNDWVDIGEGKQIPYPLTLDLYYMLNIFTPDKTSNLDEHRIVGDVMRVFHANPIIDPIYYEGTLNPNEPPIGLPWEELKIIHHSLSLEELAAIWHAINHPYRLSIAYEVSAVQIAPPDHKSRRVRRVDSTHVKAVTLRGVPAISRITPERCYAGDFLKIIGEHFESHFLKLYVNDIVITPEATSASEISFHAPASLPPGLYSVMVCNEEGCSEEKRFEEISPFLYRLDPQMKYAEDPDFPKENGKPVYTIWGGNFLTEPPLPLKILATPEGKPELSFSVPQNRIRKQAITWVLDPIPPDLHQGKTTVVIELNGTRKSNALSLEFPKPKIHKVTPETVTDLSQALVITGEYFRDGNTKILLRSIADNTVTELSPLSVKNNSEIRVVLPNTTAKGLYQAFVRVYGAYDSGPHDIKVDI